MVKLSKYRTRRRRRQSVAGKVLPPIDVRSAGDFGEMIKRFKSGPLTIVLVYADWCGHCHHFMPHFDAAAKSSNRSVQAVKINENILSQANSYINKNVNNNAPPINVEGYPSVLLVKKDGTVLNELNATKDTKVMMEVMEQSGSLAETAGLDKTTSTSARNKMSQNLGISNEGAATGESNSMRNIDLNEGSLLGNISMNSPSVSNSPSLRSVTSQQGENTTSIGVTPSEIKSIASLQAVEGNSIATPPNSAADREEGVSYRAVRPEGSMQGGSLYHAMSQAAYTLAPTAVLLAAAAGLRDKLRNKKTKKRSKRAAKKKTRRYRKK